MNKRRVLIVGASSSIGNLLFNIIDKNKYEVIGTYYHNNINNYDYLDVTNEIEVDNYFKNIGNVDILINMFSLNMDNDIFDKSKEEFMKVVEANLGGMFLTCKYYSKYNDEGLVINMASTNGENTYSSISMDYDASKAGIINLTKNLANRFNNIKYICLSPNWINTESVLEMNPLYLESELKRIGQSKLIEKEEVVNKIIEIIEDDNYKSRSIIKIEGKYE